MNPFVFQSPTKVLFGEFTTSSCGDVLADLGGRKALVVADAFLLESGAIGPLLESLKDPFIFSDVPPDSDVSCVNQAAALARTNKCDCIVAVGGGSVIDTAKVVNICLSLGGDLMDYQGLNILDKKLMPMVVVPTTAGTGSEVSFVAMIKDKQENKKMLFGSPFLAPDVALLDPTLILSLPPKLTAATGMDAITHSIESFVASGTCSVATDAMCLESFSLMCRHLPVAFKTGDDLEARAGTLVGSTMAGIAFTNSGVGVVHAIAHSIGALFNTHHGMTNAVLLPYGMEFNLPQVADRYARLGRYIGLSGANDQEVAGKLIEHVRKLIEEFKLPVTLKALGVPELDEDTLNLLAEMASSDPAIMFNPRETSAQDLIGLIKRAY